VEKLVYLLWRDLVDDVQSFAKLAGERGRSVVTSHYLFSPLPG
jgi:hypothetical protein